MHLRIGSYDVNTDYIVGFGNDRVFLNASACPTMPFIEVSAAALKTIRTQWLAQRQSMIANNGSVAPPGQTTQKRRTTGRKVGRKANARAAHATAGGPV